MSRDILLNLIDPDPAQPRQNFDEASLKELAESIEANGLVIPILVRPAGERFFIIHGERRYRAFKLLGRESIPADVREVTQDEAGWLALVENVQRNDLTPIEEAKAYQARLDSGLTQKALGRRIGKSQSYIAGKLRLLKLSEEVQGKIDRGEITEGHAKQLLRLETLEQVNTLASLISENNLGVALTKKLVDAEMIMYHYKDCPINDRWWTWIQNPLSHFTFTDVAKLGDWLEDNWDDEGLIDGFLPRHTHVLFVAGDYLALSKAIWEEDNMPWLGAWLLEELTVDQLVVLRETRNMLKEVSMTIDDIIFISENLTEDQAANYYDEFIGTIDFPVDVREFIKNHYRFMFDKAIAAKGQPV